MKVCSTDICVDCRNFKAIKNSRGFEAEIIDITENTKKVLCFNRCVSV